MNRSPTITAAFNIVLLLYLVFFACATIIFEPIPQADVPWDWVYEWNPILAVCLGFVVIGVTIFWGSKLIQYFWNRFLTDLFQVRSITFNEAMGIFLIFFVIGF